MQKFKFTIPDSYELTPINIKLVKMMRTHPDYFYDDVQVTSVYGCPEGCLWNGGRCNFGQYNSAEIDEMLQIYQKNNLGYRFTFTNALLKKIHLKDYYANVIASRGNRAGNMVIVATKLMYRYLRKKYSNYKFIISMTTMLNDLQTVNCYSQKHQIVLPLKFNNKFEILKQLKNPGAIEVLVNEFCVENCNFRKEHYKLVNEANMLLNNNAVWFCLRGGDFDPEKVKSKFHHVDHELLKEYGKLGITQFKIEGRDKPEHALNGYLEMFVKPEYQISVRKELENIDPKKDWCWNISSFMYKHR